MVGSSDGTGDLSMSWKETPKRTFELSGHSAAERIAELEVENTRLQRLVAELLLKNQQLRKPEA